MTSLHQSSDVFYEYRLQARRPATYAALGVGMITGYTVIFANALLAAIPVTAYIGVVLWRLVRNPTAGLRFTPLALEVFDHREIRHFPFRDIRSARLRTGVFSDDECVLVMANGPRIALPPDALPPIKKLRAEFLRRGIIAT
ncbi:hypothetical protein [Albirhodobacter sp. R86504]|uniref:hypothetical protein n=1 Tax=Albirhodobacter sp. R86504 TaxID=3093848 RepID=UPI003672EA00